MGLAYFVVLLAVPYALFQGFISVLDSIIFFPQRVIDKIGSFFG